MYYTRQRLLLSVCVVVPLCVCVCRVCCVTINFIISTGLTLSHSQCVLLDSNIDPTMRLQSLNLLVIYILFVLQETESFLQAPAKSLSKNAPSCSRSTLTLHAIDVNTYPDSKRRLALIQRQVESNLAPDVLNLKFLTETVRDMEQESSQAEFWDDQEKAQGVLSEMNRCTITYQLRISLMHNY